MIRDEEDCKGLRVDPRSGFPRNSATHIEIDFQLECQHHRLRVVLVYRLPPLQRVVRLAKEMCVVSKCVQILSASVSS